MPVLSKIWFSKYLEVKAALNEISFVIGAGIDIRIKMGDHLYLVIMPFLNKGQATFNIFLDESSQRYYCNRI